jgi:hypothetical protein
LAARAATRLDGRAGQRTAPWLAVVLLAAVETLGLAPSVRVWPAAEPRVSELVRQGVGWLRPHTPDFVTGASDPLAAWLAALLPASTRWLGPAGVAVGVVICLALARKTDGQRTGARLARVLAALAGRIVMAAYLLHLAVGVLDPVATGLAATSPWLVVGIGIGVAILFRSLTGLPRTMPSATAPWPARLVVGGGLLALALVLLQHVPLPDAVAPPARSVTPRGTP